jgi:hypothetical protein
MSQNTQYAVLVRSYEGAPWNLKTAENMRPTLEEAKALWRELAHVCGVEHVKILDPQLNEVTGDTRPDRRVLGVLTAKLYAAADHADVTRAYAEDAAEYLLNTNATMAAMFARLVDEVVRQAQETTLYARMEAACILAVAPYRGTTAVTEETLHDLRQICLRTVAGMLPRDVPMPDVYVAVDANNPTCLNLAVSRKK